MNLNNKGVSLIELIISVGLISIVIVFLYSLLSDLNDEIINSDFAINNQITRFEIINEVQNDFLGETIKNINVDYNTYVITIQYESLKYTIITIEYADLNDSYEGDFIKVINKDGVTTKWQVDENCYIDRDIFSSDSSYNIVEDMSGSISGYKISIPIYTTNNFNNSLDNNPLDDLSFAYIDY